MQGLPSDIDFKFLGDEMARKHFAFENDDLELGKLSENALNKFNIDSKQTFKKMNSNQKINTKFNRNDSELKMFPSNLSTNKSKIVNKHTFAKNEKKESSETGKLNQEGNSNIIYTTTNLNTNINTGTNANSRANTNMNNNINTNNNGIDNQNGAYSEKNSLINENSSRLSNENEYINIDESETNTNQIIQKDKDITVEIVNPSFLEKNYDNTIKGKNIDVNIKLNINNNKLKKSKIKNLKLYEREMKNRKRKNEKLKKMPRNRPHFTKYNGNERNICSY